MPTTAYLATGLRCLIGTVVLLALCGKTTRNGGFGAFVSSLHGLRLLPARYARPAAVAVAAGEGTAVIVLALPWQAAAPWGFCLAAALLAVLTAGVGLALRRGARAPCRCFGGTAKPLGGHHLLRNVLLTGLALLGAVISAAPPPPAHPAGTALAAATGVVLGGLIAVLDELTALFRPPVAPQRR
ncbi:MauE/DoxX family redox-associated membrane protein [Streptomyces lydicus]|uniref:MauE/DoxX family redox-associated membrane protein n=1 Tax=Streptomyces lydicus TaxID=47763 RepID=UPI00379048BB